MKLAVRATGLGKKITLIATAFVLAVSTLTATLPFIASKSASAVSGYNYSNVTLDQAQWTVDRQAPSGGWSTDPANNRVIITINQLNSSSTGFNKTEGVSAPVPAGTTSLTGSFYIAPDWSSKDTVRVGLWGVTSTPVSWPIIEYAANVDGYTGWRVWDTVNGGWTNVAAATNVGGSNAVEVLLNPIKNTFSFYVNNALVTTLGANGAVSFASVILNQYNKGTGQAADNYTVDWRNLKAGKAPVTTPCTTSNVVWTTNLSAWNSTPGLDDTRNNGHNELTGDGVDVYTDNDSGQAKATGYLAVNYPLANNGDQTIAASMDWTQDYGTLRPGLQLVVDFNNDGSSDGILVGEPIYGNNWWLTNGSQQFVKDNAPRTGGGNGSNYFGTLNEWLTMYPSAQVKSVGYSLGSGVHAGGTIKRLSFGCTTYRFDNVAPAVPVHELPTNNALITTNDFWFDWEDVEGAVRYEIQNSTNSSTDGSGSFTNVMWTGDYQNIQPTESKAHSVGASGTWYWQVRSVDAAGNASAWSTPWGVTIDTVAPGAPTLVTPDWYVANGATKTLDWNAPGDTDIAYYQYAEYNNVAPTSDTTTPSWVKTVTAPTTETTDTAWQTDVQIYWRVRAVDTAGNVGPWSETRLIVTDKTKPNSTDTLPSVVGGAISVTQTITDNYAPASGKLRIWKLVDGTTTQDNSKFFAIGDVPVDSNGNVAYNFNASNLYGSGQYIAKFTATDRAGNAIVTQKYFTVDATAPVVTLSANSVVTDTPTFTGTVNDPNAQVFIAVGNSPAAQATVTGTTWSYTVPAALNDGTYAIAVVAVDQFGNVSNPGANGSLVVATAPVDEEEEETPVDEEEEVIEEEEETQTTSTVTTTNPTITGPTTFATILGGGTLGASDDNTDNTPTEEVEGVSSTNNLAQAVDADNTDGSALGLAWYWWLLILAGGATGIWWLVAALRGRNAE